jgi:hypothetical protein
MLQKRMSFKKVNVRSPYWTHMSTTKIINTSEAPVPIYLVVFLSMYVQYGTNKIH